MLNERAKLTDDRRITLEQLRTLVSIVEVGGFQGASRQMHRTQSAVTQSLKKLEEILGCRLLERRQGHVLGLTTEGERFFPALNKKLRVEVTSALSAELFKLIGRGDLDMAILKQTAQPSGKATKGISFKSPNATRRLHTQ